MEASGSARDAVDGASRLVAFLLLLSMAVAIVLLAPSARAQPPVPMLVHGHAYDANGTPLAVGTPIRGLVDGVVYSNDSQVSDATGAYSILLAGNWMGNGTASETPTIKEGADIGDVVIFAAGDFTNATEVFNETVIWSPGAIAAHDLHLAAPGTQPDDIKIQAVVTQPARQDNPYVLICDAGPADVGLPTYYLQTDIPGSYEGPKFPLTGRVSPGGVVQVNVTDPGFFNVTGDAVKLVWQNVGGLNAAADGHDVPVDRVEYNATAGGTLDWEPGSTVMGSAPAPGPGSMLARGSICGDTNSPLDFAVRREPGLPAVSTVSVSLLAPTQGQALPGGQTFTVRWSLGSNTFTLYKYLRVWVNVSYGGSQRTVLDGAYGATSLAWDVPNIAEPAASVNVTVVDPFGARASQTSGVAIQLESPWPIVVAVLIIAVVIAFLLFAFLSRRRARAGPKPPATPPPESATPAAAALPPNAAIASPTATTKVCPRCGTLVQAADDSCFFCGYLFVTPPPP